MVINHTQAVLDMFEAVLSGEGYQVYVLMFGQDTFREVERVMPDLLILDYIANRERNGWQLIRMLKNSEGMETIPVIVCTTAIKLSDEFATYVVEHNISVIAKPFDIDDLLSTVESNLLSASPDSDELGSNGSNHLSL